MFGRLNCPRLYSLLAEFSSGDKIRDPQSTVDTPSRDLRERSIPDV